jgi:hypothetical protein
MRSILVATTALAVLCGPAYAQTSNSNSGSNAAVNTASGSQSSSASNPKVNVIGNPIGNGASSSNSGAKANSNSRSASRSAAVGNSTTVNVSGYAGVDKSGTGGSSGNATGNGGYLEYGGSYTVRNTPEVIAPSVLGGNPCAVGASGGIALPGFGLALGGTWADRACERRQQAALLFNMGEQKVAIELMCQDDNVRSAMKTSGKACVTHVPIAQAPASTQATMAPAPAGVMVAAIPAAPRPSWCAIAAPSTEASKAYVAQACNK